MLILDFSDLCGTSLPTAEYVTGGMVILLGSMEILALPPSPVHLIRKKKATPCGKTHEEVKKMLMFSSPSDLQVILSTWSAKDKHSDL